MCASDSATNGKQFTKKNGVGSREKMSFIEVAHETKNRVVN